MNKEPNTKPKTLAIQPKSEWTIAEALQFANTLSNHGWTRDANADAASSCIYALCRKLRERGNAARLREALENSNGLLEELAAIGEWGESAREQIAENNAALSKPPRNCDRFANLHDAWLAWQSYCADNIGTKTMKFHVWLYSTAEEGEADGSK